MKIYDEQGCYIIAMLAKTEKAKKFRKQVSKLLMQYRKKVDVIKEYARRYRERKALLRLGDFLDHSRVFNREKLKRFAEVDSMDFLSNEELGNLFGCSGSHISRVRRYLKNAKGEFNDKLLE